MKSLGLFRSNVLSALKELKWSQADLAKRTGIAQPSINIYLSGKKAPNVETCERIAEAIGVSLGKLFSEQEQESLLPHPPHTFQDCLDVVTKSAAAGATLDDEARKAAIKQYPIGTLIKLMKEEIEGLEELYPNFGQTEPTSPKQSPSQKPLIATETLAKLSMLPENQRTQFVEQFRDLIDMAFEALEESKRSSSG